MPAQENYTSTKSRMYFFMKNILEILEAEIGLKYENELFILSSKYILKIALHYIYKIISGF